MRVINFVALALLLPTGMFTQAQPTIIRNPASQTVPAGAAVTFVLSAASADVLSYQWSFRGEALSDATNATLRIAQAGLENLGSYSAVVKDSSGSIETKPAKLSLNVTIKPRFDPAFQVALVSSNLSLNWRGEGTVQTAPSPEGPWTAAGSIRKNSFATPLGSSATFYRLSNPHPRNVTLFVPSTYRADSQLPLLVGIHGYGVDGNFYEAFMGIKPLAESEGFLYCHPDGVTNSKGARFWNTGEVCCDVERQEINDVGFLREVIEQITREYHPDSRRIHVTGHSNGAFMTFRFAMENSDLVASIAAISGTMDQVTTLPAPAQPVSILQIHGTADEAIPYNGGKLPVPFPQTLLVTSALEVVARWAKWNSCGELITDAAPTLDSDRTLAGLDTIVSRSVCPNGIAVEHWAISKGLHSPSWSTTFTQTMVQWLLAHPKP